MYFELAPRDFGALAQVAVDSHSAGRYIFRYVVSKDGEMIDTFEFEHQLGAKHASVEHELKLNVQPQDCRVLLTVLRAGAECDAREGWTRTCQSDKPLGAGCFLGLRPAKSQRPASRSAIAPSSRKSWNNCWRRA